MRDGHGRVEKDVKLTIGQVLDGVANFLTSGTDRHRQGALTGAGRVNTDAVVLHLTSTGMVTNAFLMFHSFLELKAIKMVTFLVFEVTKAFGKMSGFELASYLLRV